MKAEAGDAQREGDDWARWYHQWQSRINQGSTQVNSTGVYRAMYWSLSTTQERAQTRLCYRYCPMAKEERVKGYQRRMAKGALIRGRKAEMKRREARHSH